MSDKMEVVEAAKKAVLARWPSAFECGTIWFLSRKGATQHDDVYIYLGSTWKSVCAEHSLMVDGTFNCPICGMDKPHTHSADEIAASKLPAPLTEDAPSKHEVLLRSAHPNLFVLQEGTMIEVWTHIIPELRTLLALSTPLARALEEAYEHPSVQAYVRTHKASTVGDAPKEIDWTSDDKEVVKYAVPTAICFYTELLDRFIVMPSDMSYELGCDEGKRNSWKSARKHPTVVAFEREHNPTLKVPASPAGELEGALEHGVNCNKVVHVQGRAGYLHAENDDTPYDVDGVMYCGRCHYFMDARAALSSKPAPEGIPEVPKDRLEAIAADDFCEFDECTTHEPKIGVCVACDAIYAARECLNLRASISAKDAEMAKFQGFAQEWHKVVETTCVLMGLPAAGGAEECRSSIHAALEAAEAKLASLRASSESKDFGIRRILECMKGIRASLGLPPHEVMDVLAATCMPAEVEHNLRASGDEVREEAFREAAKIASSGIYNGDYPNGSTDSRDEVCRWISARILSLLPTSPEPRTTYPPNEETMKYVWAGDGPEPICTCGNPITKCTRMHDDHYPPRRYSSPE